MWWLVSRFSRMFSFAAGWKKLGQPLPEWNFAFDSNSGRLQQTHTYMPGLLLFSRPPQKAASVFFAAGDAVLLRRQAKPPLGVGKDEHRDFHRAGEFAIGADDSNMHVRHCGFLLRLGPRLGCGRSIRRAAATGRNKKDHRQ